MQSGTNLGHGKLPLTGPPRSLAAPAAGGGVGISYEYKTRQIADLQLRITTKLGLAAKNRDKTHQAKALALQK